MPTRLMPPRKAAPKPTPPDGSCWTTGGSAASRLTNAPTMIATMCAAADSDIFGRIVEVVMAEKHRRGAGPP
jgi:hypothetical protein